MGLRGPKPIYTPDELAARRRERNRVRHWTKQGLEAPPLGTARAVNGSPEAAANALSARKRGGTLKRHRDQDKARAFIVAYKLAHPCVDCGFADPRALQFDHRDRAEKLFEISKAASRGWPVARLEAEIAKCDVRCANCHTIKTQTEAEWDRVW